MSQLHPRHAFAALSLLGFVACQSGAPLGEPEPYTFVEHMEEDPTTIGFFLTDFDSKMRAWSRLQLTPRRAEKESSQFRALEVDMRRTTAERVDELVEELEFGLSRNRMVAAAALGFTGDRKAQGPLLAALSSRDDDIVKHALMALGLLAFRDTPVGQITYLLRRHDSPRVRSNAAFALQKLTWAGARDEEILSSAREGLVDSDPGVRSQSAAILGILDDVYSIDALADVLADEFSLVSSAAAAALGRIGYVHLEEKGNVARHLVDALEAEKTNKRIAFRRELTRLRDADLGSEVEPWKEWAYRLP